MNRFERWFLRRIIRREVRQGYTHDLRITALYREIHDAAKREFYEDNFSSRNEYLREWFENSLDKAPDLR